jgi:hypothetical protein
MTTTLNTSCSENTMVLSARRGVSACMYFLVSNYIHASFIIMYLIPFWCFVIVVKILETSNLLPNVPQFLYSILVTDILNF